MIANLAILRYENHKKGIVFSKNPVHYINSTLFFRKSNINQEPSEEFKKEKERKFEELKMMIFQKNKVMKKLIRFNYQMVKHNNN
jgi:hypothetical protein